MSMPKRRIVLPKAERHHMARGLKRLGFSSYADYLRSPHWVAARRRLRQRACQRCGAKSVLVLHHMTYANLGREGKTDVCTLCVGCHGSVHAAARRTGSLLVPEAFGAPKRRPRKRKTKKPGARAMKIRLEMEEGLDRALDLDP